MAPFKTPVDNLYAKFLDPVLIDEEEDDEEDDDEEDDDEEDDDEEDDDEEDDDEEEDDEEDDIFDEDIYDYIEAELTCTICHKDRGPSGHPSLCSKCIMETLWDVPNCIFCEDSEPPYDAIQNHDVDFELDDVNNCFCWACMDCLEEQVYNQKHLKCKNCQRSRQQIVWLHATND
jgi:hypothetical protein